MPLACSGSALDMPSRKCKFGQLDIDEHFLYHGQLYRKESTLSAILIRWTDGRLVTSERVSHRFYPEIVVELPADDDQPN
jgi:hypothetical protein